MQVKIETLINVMGSLGNLGKMVLPIKTAHKLSKLTKMVNEELKTYDESRQKLVQKYKTDDPEDKGMVKIKPECVEEFNKEYKELVEIEVELNWEPMTYSELGDITISAVDLNALELFIKEAL
jgi:predicted ATP-dependent protease